MKKLLLLATLLFSACAANASNTQVQSTRDFNAVVATYGDHSILARDYIYIFNNTINQQEHMLRMFGFSEEEITNHWLQSSENGYTFWELAQQSALDQVLDQGTLILLAQQAGISYNQPLLEESIEGMEEQIAIFLEQGENAYQIFYDFFGIPFDEFENVQRNILTGAAFVEYLSSGIEITQEEALAYHQENPGIIPSTALARVVHILIATAELDEDEAYTKATEILARVNAGEDPRDLAAIYSDDTPLGFLEFERGRMVAPFEEWAFNANYGDTGIVHSQFGFHVMYSEGHDPEPPLTQEDIENIKAMIRNDRAFDLMMELIEEANIDWIVDYYALNEINI